METKSIKFISPGQLLQARPDVFFETQTVRLASDPQRCTSWLAIAFSVSGDNEAECTRKKAEILRRIDAASQDADDVAIVLTDVVSIVNLFCEVSVKITGGSK